MRDLPLHHPGVADHRSATRLLWWLAKGQWHTLLLGMLFGIAWMSAQAVLPAVIGRAIDKGVAAKDSQELLKYAGLMFAIGLVQAAAGIIRHRYAVTNWLTAAYRTVQLVGRQAVTLGGTLPRKVSTGEVVAIGTSDLEHLGNLMDVSARFAGAIVSFVIVAVILLQTSVTLGLVVLIGVPLLTLLVGPLLKPLQVRSTHQRELMGSLSNTASDIVSGLRVLRGIGGEQVFHGRYQRESQNTRRAGVEVARLQSVLDALQVFLPGVFVVLVVWIGARYAVEGRISAGELVAFYGYSAFLMIPLRTATEYFNRLIRARVAAQRVCRVLSLTTDHPDPEHPSASPPVGSSLRDLRSGLTVAPGTLVAVVSERPDESAALAERLGLTGAGDRRRTCCSATYPWPPSPARRYAGGSSSRTPRRLCSPVASATASTSAGTATSRGPWTRRRPRTSSTGCPRASTAGSRRRAAPSPAGSGSGWCSSARWRSTPRCSSSSSPPLPSTPTPRPGSPPGSGHSVPAGSRS